MSPNPNRMSQTLAALPDNYIERLIAMDEQIKNRQRVIEDPYKTSTTAMQKYRTGANRGNYSRISG